MHLSSFVIYFCLTMYIAKVNGEFFCSVQSGAGCNTTLQGDCCVTDNRIAICNSPLGKKSGSWVTRSCVEICATDSHGIGHCKIGI